MQTVQPRMVQLPRMVEPLQTRRPPPRHRRPPSQSLPPRSSPRSGNVCLSSLQSVRYLRALSRGRKVALITPRSASSALITPRWQLASARSSARPSPQKLYQMTSRTLRRSSTRRCQTPLSATRPLLMTRTRAHQAVCPQHCSLPRTAFASPTI